MPTDEEHTCCICGRKFTGYGNNPEPLKTEGVCCDECNEKVIEARISRFFENLKSNQGHS